MRLFVSIWIYRWIICVSLSIHSWYRLVIKFWILFNKLFISLILSFKIFLLIITILKIINFLFVGLPFWHFTNWIRLAIFMTIYIVTASSIIYSIFKLIFHLFLRLKWTFSALKILLISLINYLWLIYLITILFSLTTL